MSLSTNFPRYLFNFVFPDRSLVLMGQARKLLKRENKIHISHVKKSECWEIAILILQSLGFDGARSHVVKRIDPETGSEIIMMFEPKKATEFLVNGALVVGR